MTYAQRSFYASNHKGNYPQLLPRFGATDDNNTKLANRIGEENEDNTTTTGSNPSDAVHDSAEVNRVASWPKDRQPFWYINQQHINNQRGQKVPCINCVNPQQTAQQPLPQSPFASRS
ncbi:hypothetical protein L9F63_020955 [Diploptera punctata]|uniref:Uncharacterized protein n=1 Tax=Diploptera punctata TaxID=6984 RepID=A0AAD7ZPU5_DIPPU|nr:hypothetical protein L9F63_020955 [Diploptera punctata]